MRAIVIEDDIDIQQQIVARLKAEGFAVEMAKQAGFEVTYFGYFNDRATNRPGDDPFRVVRVEDCFLQRLPGNGRKSLAALFRDQWNLRSLPRRLSASA